jgi:DNA-binding IscR family transcriptional regulator
MTPESKILKDLAAGQTTADSLAPRVGLRTEAAEAILRRLRDEGKVTSRPLGGILANTPVYRLAEQPSPSI